MNISNASQRLEQDQKRDMPILGSMETLAGALIQTVLLKNKIRWQSSLCIMHIMETPNIPLLEDFTKVRVAVVIWGWELRKGERDKVTQIGCHGHALDLPCCRLKLEGEIHMKSKEFKKLPKEVSTRYPDGFTV